MKRLLLASFAMGPLLSGCYLTTQSASFLSMQFSAKSTARLLKDPALPEGTRKFLELVNGIKAFGREELGLASGKNYTTYVFLDRSWVALVVQAAPELSLDPWFWNYPVVGKLPYRGFYREADARREAERLKEKKLDVIIRGVDAFSTLGFFKDPLYSFMEEYSEYELARLILHEETHATLFLKKHADFNEELAVFVGDTGALAYMQWKYGDAAEAEERERIAFQAADKETFRRDILELASRLRPLYGDESLSRDEKLLRKNEIISLFQTEFRDSYAIKYRTENYRDFSDMRINNAYISLYLLYGERQDSFSAVYEGYDGDLAGFIADIVREAKKANRRRDSPWTALEYIAAPSDIIPEAE
ncbi:MAG: aminopeptidase [Spirochaetaceae bacterium]|nr:aminopeptidase [Spirochaetaceae bacterium]